MLPAEEALSNYRSGQDSYLSTQDYNKLMTSLADAKSMYKHTPLISKAIKIDGYIDQYLSLEEGGITLVEARKLGQALGMEVKWDARTMQMLLIKDGRELTVLPGSRYIYEGDKFICLEATTRIIEGKVFIPLRGLSEYIGKKVEYTTTKPWINIY
ncbi:copper amine oxidase N-terminal domain-containing protein [Zhenhengia yiwuensis]|uniref:copper amine oxidase N-terminal domain-containing protein n=1 Tax=Zhenhengia yiwuensis TaxID=2763666 RepID=UPI002A75E0A1|nr:copper amine oxidase N-terminal domain-containing protein [Zhenhengia yiwuensis]MDY3368615.1 copper amine oxidase N-terminal domain-containing protein [Zhenhengia yiwuensis]